MQFNQVNHNAGNVVNNGVPVRKPAKIDWTKGGAPRARVIDLATGEHIAVCAMADEETGAYEQWAFDPEKKNYLCRDGGPYRVKGQSKIRIDLLRPDEPYFSPEHPPRYASDASHKTEA